MKEVLEKILKELKQQTKYMEYLYEKKDTYQSQMGGVHKSMDVLKMEFAKHPELMKGPMGKIMDDLFRTMEGKK